MESLRSRGDCISQMIKTENIEMDKNQMNNTQNTENSNSNLQDKIQKSKVNFQNGLEKITIARSNLVVREPSFFQEDLSFNKRYKSSKQQYYANLQVSQDQQIKKEQKIRIEIDKIDSQKSQLQTRQLQFFENIEQKISENLNFKKQINFNELAEDQREMECSKQKKRAFDKNPFSFRQISPDKESSLKSFYKGQLQNIKNSQNNFFFENQSLSENKNALLQVCIINSKFQKSENTQKNFDFEDSLSASSIDFEENFISSQKLDFSQIELKPINIEKMKPVKKIDFELNSYICNSLDMN